MAPIKFEENLKDKLEKRTINPSDNTWDTLANRLDKAEHKNNKKGLWWLGIAASIIGLLLITYPFFKSDTVTPNQPIIVDNTEKTTIKIEDKVEPNIVEEKVKEVLVNTNTTKIEHKASVKLKKNNSNYLANNVNEKGGGVQIPNNVSINKIIKKNTILLETERKTLESNVAELNTEKITSLNSDATIDSLLSIAIRDIAMSSSNKETKVPIDHNELLQDVEDDLEESFREKILRTVKGGYRSVKTYVAERNE